MLGILGLLFFLIGLLFFLIKNTESLTISISPRGESGCTVMVAGQAQDWLIMRVQAALAGTSPPGTHPPRSQVVQDAQLGKLKK